MTNPSSPNQANPTNQLQTQPQQPSQQFIHLGIHSEFSISDSIVRIKALVKQAVADGQKALALTDLSNLFATVKFYRACLGAGIKPIIGAEIRVDDENTRITLLAMNNEGYQNLTKLVSIGYTDGQKDGIPIVQRSQLFKLNAGIIALLTEHSHIGQVLTGNVPEKANALIAEWQAVFADRLYFAIKRTTRQGEDAFIKASIHAAAKFAIPIVAHNDVRFIEQEDFEAHEARVCITNSYVLGDPNRPRNYSDQQYLKTQAQMIELFADLPMVISNTLSLAKRCNVILRLGENFLPDYPIRDGFEHEAIAQQMQAKYPDDKLLDSFFRVLSAEGLEKRLDKLFPVDTRDNWADSHHNEDGTPQTWQAFRQAYDDRLEIELNIIINMGFPGYFLIVMDFIRWSKANDVPVGPGRGSGAGSLVAYALDITDLDPLHYELLFERFLNPERVSMPDFDIDFCIEGRDKVIQYVAETYGREAVSQIITFGTMAAKAVVRDVARVQGKSYGLADRISKLIPATPGISLTKAVEEEQQLKNLLSDPSHMDYDDANEIWEMAIKLEGITRNVGKHAGGVLIAPNKITDFSAIYADSEGHRVSQFDKDDVEAAGLVKFDFLGLRNLTVIASAIRNINHRRKKESLPLLELDDVPLDDKATYEQVLADGKTTAVFQLESSGMKKYLKQLKPTNIDDVIAMCALYRPGPLGSGMVESFINRKHGIEEVVYDHEYLEPILNNTYGIIVYQEQVMQISQAMAGYTLGGADMLRRAMGKKKPEEMAKQRDIFLSGAKDKNIDDDVAGGVFDLMEKFAEYGFNKSHSACYGVLAYQTAYLKHYYPAEFMAAVLTSEMNNTDSVVFLINDCRENFNLTVANPSVNQSKWYFVAETPNNIVYGLGAIKGVGEGAVESIVQARQRDGDFKDLYDFCNRVDTKKVNKRTLEALIRAGCFDDFASHLRPDLAADNSYEIRGALFAQLPNAVQAAEQERQNQEFGSMDMFAEIDNVTKAPPLPTGADYIWGDKKRLKHEKDTLGLYLTGHPIDEYREELKRYTGGSQLDSLTPTKFNDTALFAGLIIDVANFGNRIAITIDDGTARQEVSCFSDKFQKYKDILKVDNVVVIRGSISDYNDRTFTKLFDVYGMLEARLRWLKQINIKVHANDVQLIDKLQPLLKPQQLGKVELPNLQRFSAEGQEQQADQANSAEYQSQHQAKNQTTNNDKAYPNADDIVNNDGCIPIQLSVYDYYATAQVSLLDNWRMYPTDDNLAELRKLLDAKDLGLVWWGKLRWLSWWTKFIYTSCLKFIVLILLINF